jgi:hypothetical protein
VKFLLRLTPLAVVLAGCSSTTTYRKTPFGGGIEVRKEGALGRFVDWITSHFNVLGIIGLFLVVASVLALMLGAWFDRTKALISTAEKQEQSKAKTAADAVLVERTHDNVNLVLIALDSDVDHSARLEAVRKINDPSALRAAIDKVPPGELKDIMRKKVDIMTLIETPRQDTVLDPGHDGVYTSDGSSWSERGDEAPRAKAPGPGVRTASTAEEFVAAALSEDLPVATRLRALQRLTSIELLEQVHMGTTSDQIRRASIRRIRRLRRAG